MSTRASALAEKWLHGLSVQTVGRRVWFAKVTIGLAAMLTLAGCAGRATNFLIPTGQQFAGTSRIDILAATTR